MRGVKANVMSKVMALFPLSLEAVALTIREMARMAPVAIIALLPAMSSMFEWIRLPSLSQRHRIAIANSAMLGIQ